MSIKGLLKLDKGFKIPLGSLKAILVKVSQNFIKSHLKFCLISQILVHSLCHVCIIVTFSYLQHCYLLLNYCKACHCWTLGQFWLVLYNQSTLISLRKHLFIGKFSFPLFFTGHQLGSTFTQTGLITRSNQNVLAVHSCNN